MKRIVKTTLIFFAVQSHSLIPRHRKFFSHATNTTTGSNPSTNRSNSKGVGVVSQEVAIWEEIQFLSGIEISHWKPWSWRGTRQVGLLCPETPESPLQRFPSRL